MRFAWLAIVLLFGSQTAHAQSLEVECVQREECELDLLAACPQGAVITGERLQPAEGVPEPAYTRVISYACGTAPVASAPVSGEQQAQLAMVEARQRARPGQIRLLQAQRSKVRIVGPVILTAIGAGLTGTPLVLAALADRGEKRGGLLVVSVFPAAFLLLPGTIWLQRSVQERRSLKHQIDALSLARPLPMPSLALSKHGVSVGLSVSF